MSKKNNKGLSFLGTLIIAGIALIWNYFQPSEKTHQPEATAQSQQNQAKTSAQQNTQVQLGENYDYIMRDDAIGQNKSAPVDYYMLALSWSPGFCQAQKERYNGNLPQSLMSQCGTQQYGWVIHGLWPQNANARSVSDHPRFCQGDLSMVDPAVIKPYLADSPSANLLQGEWEKHGACAFKNANAYFEKQQNLYRTLNLPDRNLPRKELFAWLKKHNPQLKGAYLGASHNELFICYDLQWQVMDCPR
ncbi:ribonuclease T2 family protein [Avibacterium avium]|uniref:ribonuclease T2 family protein n=1 Tax=Avibacterium avium TaxID=751 RepID=UPI003BF8A8F8